MNILHRFRLLACVLVCFLVLVNEQFALGIRETKKPEQEQPAAELEVAPEDTQRKGGQSEPADVPQKEAGEGEKQEAAPEEKSPAHGYSRDQIEEMFQYIPLKDPESPREVSIGRYYLAPPAREEEGWSFNVYARKAGSGQSFDPRYREPGYRLNHLPVLEEGVNSGQALSYDLVNTGYDFGDTVEYYFELRIKETEQTFIIPREGTLRYQIKSVPKNMEEIFAVEPVPMVAAGDVYDAWAVSRYSEEEFPLKDVTMIIRHREAGSGAYQSTEAPRMAKGFIVAVPTTGYRANSSVEFYLEFYRQDSIIGTYGSIKEPLSFRVVPR